MNSISSVSSYFNFACNIEQDILGITDDSRDVKNGYLFVARAGINSHGIKFIEDAISNGELFGFTGPINKQDGSVFLAEGEVATRAQLDTMMFYVEGIKAPMP